jgi:hypothetical protein
VGHQQQIRFHRPTRCQHQESPSCQYCAPFLLSCVRPEVHSPTVPIVGTRGYRTPFVTRGVRVSCQTMPQ